MSQRTFVEVNYWLLKGVVNLAPIVNFGATGAPTLQKHQFSAAGAGGPTAKHSLVAAPTSGVNYTFGDQFGTRSIVRNTTGNFTLTLSDPYLYLIQISVQFINSGAVFNAPVMVVDSNTANTNVALNTAVGNGGIITFTFFNGAGAATDPASGDQAQFLIVLGNSGAP